VNATDLLLKVYDVNGKLVLETTKKTQAGLNTHPITELSEMQPGFYYVQLTVNGEMVTKKMVKGK